MRIARQSPIGPGATAGPWRANRGLVLDPPYGRIQLAIASERPRITREIRYPTDELPHATAPPNRGFVDTIIPGTHADQVPGKINPVRALPPVHVCSGFIVDNLICATRCAGTRTRTGLRYGYVY